MKHDWWVYADTEKKWYIWLDRGTQKRLLGLVPIGTLRLAPAKPSSASSELSVVTPGTEPHLCAVHPQVPWPSGLHSTGKHPVAFGYMKVYRLQGQQTWNLWPFRRESVLPDITPLLLNIWFSGIHLLLTSPKSHMQWEMPDWVEKSFTIFFFCTNLKVASVRAHIQIPTYSIFRLQVWLKTLFRHGFALPYRVVIRIWQKPKNIV